MNRKTSAFFILFRIFIIQPTSKAEFLRITDCFHTSQNTWFLRLCRPMCGDGYASPLRFLEFFEAMPRLMPEAQPQNQGKTDRKGTAFPHIGRHSRKENYFSKMYRN
jgi:hypothetical protein